MPFSLKNLPPEAPRPPSPKTSRWLIALASLLIAGTLLSRLLGSHIEQRDFWFIALGLPLLFWLVLVTGRIIVWLLQHIQANGWDHQREAWILAQTRRSRRAMQILHADFLTAHAEGVAPYSPLTAIMNNTFTMTMQPGREGKAHCRHARLPQDMGEASESAATSAFSRLLEPLAKTLNHLPADTPISLLFECSSSISEQTLRDLWLQIWKEYELEQAPAFIPGSGPAVIDNWLDNHIDSQAVLLVIALQIAPRPLEMSGEAAVALLLGNRLTQREIVPMALLHRPDASSGEALAQGMRQAANNVPISENEVKHLWLAGLTDSQYNIAVKHQKVFPAEAVESENVMALDESLGHTGRAACWLAIAAATEATQKMQQPQMIITGDPTQDVLWSTLISPQLPDRSVT